MERCVSPSYKNSKKLQLNGQITLTNLREKAEEDAVYKNTRSKKSMKEWKAKMLAAPGRPPPSSIPPENNDNSEEETNKEETSLEESDESSDDEPLSDYEIEGYHPCHIK